MVVAQTTIRKTKTAMYTTRIFYSKIKKQNAIIDIIKLLTVMAVNTINPNLALTDITYLNGYNIFITEEPFKSDITTR